MGMHRSLAAAFLAAIAACSGEKKSAEPKTEESTPASARDEIAMCKAMFVLRSEGCDVVQNVVLDVDRCAEDLRRTHREIPEARWVGECFLDHQGCDAVRACLDPPAEAAGPTGLEALTVPPPPPPPR